MYINLEAITKNNKEKLKKKSKVKKYLRKKVMCATDSDADFINNFLEISKLKQWKYNMKPYTLDTVADVLVNCMYYIIEAEYNYKEHYGRFKEDGWVVDNVWDGRIVVIPMEFDIDTLDAIYFEFAASL